MIPVKYSRQREAIKAYLSGTKAHPNADTVYAAIRQQYPNISMGTVYRNLSQLVEQGEALRLSCGDGGDHYDGNTAPHYHFICRDCGRVLDVEIESLSHIDTLAQASFPGMIEGHSILFRGLCPSCVITPDHN